MAFSAAEKTAEIAEAIKNKAVVETGKRTLPFTAFYAIGNQYFKAMEKRFYVSESCTGCSLCRNICPVDNIEMADGKPVFLHKNCAQCMACLQWCPAEAINCGKKTHGRTRYHHPDVQANDMMHNAKRLPYFDSLF